MKILLGPAVLHFSMLEKLQHSDVSFIKKYVVHFGLIQAFIAVLFSTLFFSNSILPWAENIRTEAEEILVHANFSKLKIEDNKMAIDIKPAIWTYSFSNTDSLQEIIAIDSTGKINPHYWDDRFIAGNHKIIKGIEFGRDNITVKHAASWSKYRYSTVFGKKDIVMTKSDVLRRIDKYLGRKWLTTIYFVLLPFFFVIMFILGVATHLAFGIITGIVISIMTMNPEKYTARSILLSMGLYVGWFYVVGLLLIVQAIGATVLDPFNDFYKMVQGIIDISLITVGYISVKHRDDLKPIKKIKRNKVSKISKKKKK